MKRYCLSALMLFCASPAIADPVLDTAFSGDGVAVVATQLAIRDVGTAVACAGAGNSDPLDDRIMIAATAVSTGSTIDPVGFIGRLDSGGVVQALNAPNDEDFDVLEIHAARVGSDGEIRASSFQRSRRVPRHLGQPHGC